VVTKYIQYHGSAVAIGLESPERSEIELQFNSFWNFGATSGELSWNTDVFAYFWTTPENFYKYLVTSSLHKILNEHPNKFKGHKGGAMGHARQLAELRRGDFIEEEFRVSEFFDADVYQIAEEDISLLRSEGYVLDDLPEKVAVLYV
jgi:hypothetical protein